MLQYFVGKIFGDFPANFNYIIGNKIEQHVRLGYYDLYEGINKNTEEEVTVFIYEKKGNNASDVKKYGGSNLNYSKKLMHPNILKVLYTYENDKRICIVTEKCRPLIYETLRGDPLWGIYEIMNAVHFINTSEYIHCLINPLSIFVNSKGRWKLSLFELIHSKRCDITTILNNLRYHIFFDYGYNLNFPNQIHPTFIDAYGLCILMTWSYKNYLNSSLSEPLSTFLQENVDGNIHTNDVEWSHSNFSRNENGLLNNLKNKEMGTVKDSIIKDMNHSQWRNNVPREIFSLDVSTSKQYIPRNLHQIYDTLYQYKNVEINLNDILNNDQLKKNSIVTIMLFLCELHMKSKSEKTDFFEKLQNHIENMPTSIKSQMILPELIQNIEISENVIICLRIILHIAKELSTDDFQKMVYPTFLKYFSLTDRSIRYALLENFSSIEKHLSPNHMNEIYHAYTHGLMDNNMSIKNESIKNFIYVFPKLKKNVASSAIYVLLQNLKVSDCCIKTNTIICVAKIARYIPSDKQNILDNVFQIGIQDASPQTKLATLQSIRVSYDQFSPKRFVKNLLPLVISSMIDEHYEVRVFAFESLEYLTDLLKKDILNHERKDKKEGEMQYTKNCNFIDKIKNIINLKNDDISEVEKNKESVFLETDKMNSLDELTGCIGGNDTILDESTVFKKHNELPTLEEKEITIPSIMRPNNSTSVGSNSKSNKSKEINSNSRKEFISGPNNFVKTDHIKEKTISHQNSKASNNKIYMHPSVNQMNTDNQNNIYNRPNEAQNKSTDMNQIYYNSNTDRIFHSNNKSTIGKKKNKRIDFDIDEFFEEFNLNKESNTPKVKLSSLL